MSVILILLTIILFHVYFLFTFISATFLSINRVSRKRDFLYFLVRHTVYKLCKTCFSHMLRTKRRVSYRFVPNYNTCTWLYVCNDRQPLGVKKQDLFCSKRRNVITERETRISSTFRSRNIRYIYFSVYPHILFNKFFEIYWSFDTNSLNLKFYVVNSKQIDYIFFNESK